MSQTAGYRLKAWKLFGKLLSRSSIWKSGARPGNSHTHRSFSYMKILLGFDKAMECGNWDAFWFFCKLWVGEESTFLLVGSFDGVLPLVSSKKPVKEPAEEGHKQPPLGIDVLKRDLCSTQSKVSLFQQRGICQWDSIYLYLMKFKPNYYQRPEWDNLCHGKSVIISKKKYCSDTVARSKLLLSQQFTSLHHCMALNIFLHWMDHHVKQTITRCFTQNTLSLKSGC